MPALPSPRPKTRPRLEIIPFIDIMFFLLATFMMVSLSMIKNEGLPVQLPQAATGAPEDRKSSVTVTVSAGEEIYLDKKEISLETLKAELSRLHRENPNLKIFINGDERADFGSAVGVLDEIRSLGIKKVSIQTKKKQ